MAVKVNIIVEKPKIWNEGNRIGTIEAISKILILVAKKYKFDAEIPAVILSSEALKDGNVVITAPAKLDLTKMTIRISSIVCFNRLRTRHRGNDLITLPVATAFYAGFTLAKYIVVIQNAALAKDKRLAKPLEEEAILRKIGEVVTSSIKELFNVDIRLN